MKGTTRLPQGAQGTRGPEVVKVFAGSKSFPKRKVPRFRKSPKATKVSKVSQIPKVTTAPTRFLRCRFSLRYKYVFWDTKQDEMEKHPRRLNMIAVYSIVLLESVKAIIFLPCHPPAFLPSNLLSSYSPTFLRCYCPTLPPTLLLPFLLSSPPLLRSLPRKTKRVLFPNSRMLQNPFPQTSQDSKGSQVPL